MPECTEHERQLLDAIKENLRPVDLGDCPMCGYDALYPATEKIGKAMMLVALDCGQRRYSNGIALHSESQERNQ